MCLPISPWWVVSICKGVNNDLSMSNKALQARDRTRATSGISFPKKVALAPVVHVAPKVSAVTGAHVRVIGARVRAYKSSYKAVWSTCPCFPRRGSYAQHQLCLRPLLSPSVVHVCATEGMRVRAPPKVREGLHVRA